jgi:hypothetical protein
MCRRVVIFVAAAVLSLALVLGTMQVVRHYVNRIFVGGHHRRAPKGHVTWLVK